MEISFSNPGIFNVEVAYLKHLHDDVDTVSKAVTLTAVFEQGKIVWTTTTENGVTTLTGYDKENGAVPAGDVVIPSKIGGKTITRIGGGFLENNKYITSVTIPEPVEAIGGAAFRGCTSLESVSLPSTLTEIDMEDEIREKYAHCSREYQLNIAQTIDLLKETFIRLVMEENHKKREKMFDVIQNELLHCVVSSPSGRSYPRNMRVKSARFHANCKLYGC